MASTDAPRPFVLPGEEIDASSVPTHKKHPLRLGPSLRLAPGATAVVPTAAGQLFVDRRKSLMWVEHNGGKYTPSPSDLVIGTVLRSVGDAFLVSLSSSGGGAESPYGTALLPHLSFEHASKKARPSLPPGSLVYARVVSAPASAPSAPSSSAASSGPPPPSSAPLTDHCEVECASAATGRADGLGPLVGGCMFAVSAQLARRLLLPRQAQDGKVVLLEELAGVGGGGTGAGGGGGGGAGKGLAFETAVGRNGRVWVRADDAKTVLVVGRALVALDENRLSVEAQRKLARRLLRGL